MERISESNQERGQDPYNVGHRMELERITELEQEGTPDSDDVDQDIPNQEYRRGSLILSSLGGGTHRTRSFLTQAPSLLQVPQYSNGRRQGSPGRRHSWIGPPITSIR